MNNGEFSRFDELVSRYLDEELAPADAAELVALLAEPVLAARFLEMTRLNSEIAGLLAAPVPDTAMVELVRTDLEPSFTHEPQPNRVHLRVVRPLQSSASAVRRATPTTNVSWRRLAWAAAFIIFVGLAAAFLVHRTRWNDTPRSASVKGKVWLVGPTGERALTAGEPWRPHEELRTVGLNSTVTVRFHDGSQLVFGADTSAVNQSGKEEHRVALEHGLVQAIVQKQPAHHPFIFATPQAEAIVVGTTLRLLVESESTRLEVTEGKVRFRRQEGGDGVIVNAGEYASAEPDVPLEARPMADEPRHVR